MEESSPSTENDDIFADAFDEFPLDDPPSTVESQESTVSELRDVNFDPESSPEFSYTTGIRRRRSSLQDVSSKISGEDVESWEGSEMGHVQNRDMINPKSEVNEEVFEEFLSTTEVGFQSTRSSVEDNDEKSSISSVGNDRGNDSISVDSPMEFDTGSSSFLVYMTGLVMKAIGFQFNLLMGVFTLPVICLYYTFAFIINPFGTIRRGIVYFISRLMSLAGDVLKAFSPSIYKRLSDYKSFLRLTLRFGWGLLWSAYVCIILVGLLFSSFIMSGLMMRFLVKEPLQMKDVLYFDYTKNSPVAYFPITSCPSVSCVDCTEKMEVAKSSSLRVIPPNHKFQAMVSLILPESDYNRNLGIFQVRVDCLSANGQVLATSRHPCMLPFKSQLIRVLLTSLKVVPLLAGYISESQILNLKIRDFTEGSVPTTCLKVIVEPRAEFQPGAGIPEIYDASLLLESDLPLLKRILWHWKKTVFIWTAMMFFMMGLLFTLCCCTPLLPRPRVSVGSAGNSSSQDLIPVGREVQ